ncbi:hypothetical protein LU298_17640 (plasmid) [Komagataeibacter intermedius]|uniref:hypothetical protein n=1 Tax=Komagataeibacter intermedius TaxID=66229 RepID=UPI001F3C8665|nr:hypothetical protein [Komagataeibacter intermedius]MCF3635419.1 hypothetical protein [Komagataeibacter intermedius]MCF3638278.1 hypothetical protein [Komagataeibacter intermedius]
MKSASFGQVIKHGLFTWLQTYPTPEMTRALYARLCDEVLVATMLTLTVQEVKESVAQWADRPQNVFYEAPARRGAWTRTQLLILGQRWLCGDKTADIAEMLGRSAGSVRAKRKQLGLPPRIRLSKIQAETILAEKRSAIPADPEAVLTWEQASLLPHEARRGRTWLVRNSLNRLTLTGHKGGDKVRWHEAANIEIAYRHFAFQNPREIARDFLISESALKSQSCWEQLPPRRGAKVPWFVHARAEYYIGEHHYIRRECLCKSGCFFWTTRKGGDRVSRRYRRSIAATHGIAA